MLSMSDPSRSRQTFNSPSSSSSTILTRVRPTNVRLGRSQSQADLPLVSKFPSPRHQQHQRTILNGITDINVSPIPSMIIPSSNDSTSPILSKSPPTATTTALMMINKQYSNNSSTYLPTVTNQHHQIDTKKISV